MSQQVIHLLADADNGESLHVPRQSVLRIIAQPAFANHESNPYNAQLYTHLVAKGVDVAEFDARNVLRGHYSIWHIHWPERPLNVRRLRKSAQELVKQMWLVRRARQRGTRIVWTTHNVGTHEGLHPWMEALLWRSFIPAVDGLISPSHAARRAALERFPRLRGVPAFVVPLGHYRDQHPTPPDRLAAREALGIPAEAKLLVYFGQIRPYKNVPGLISAFQGLRDRGAVLVVAGRPAGQVRETDLRSIARGDPRVRLDIRRVPDDVLQLYIGAADLVVLPFSAILNSSSALLALSLDRPVLLPRQGAMGELQEAVGESWIRTYESPLTATELADALCWAREAPRERRAPLDAFGWDSIAEGTLRAYEAIQATPRR